MNFCCSASFFYSIPSGLFSDASMSHLLRSGSSLFVCFYNDRKRISLCESIPEKNSIIAYSTIYHSLYFFRRNIEGIFTEYTAISPSIWMNCVIFLRSIYRGVDETSFECLTHGERVSFLEERSLDIYFFHITWFCVYREYFLSYPGIPPWNQRCYIHRNKSLDIFTARTPLFCEYLRDVLVEGVIIWSILMEIYCHISRLIHPLEPQSSRVQSHSHLCTLLVNDSLCHYSIYGIYAVAGTR